MAEAIKSRTPKCARCRNHGYTVNVKGHKGFCPHKSCACDLCGLVKERQEVSKRQIKLRRQQHQEEMMGMYVPVPPSIFSQGSVCEWIFLFFWSLYEHLLSTSSRNEPLSA